MLSIKGALMQIWKSPHMFMCSYKSNTLKCLHFSSLFLSRYLPLKFVIFSNFLHILRAHISKSKRCFNMKSSANYFHMTTKILADFQICISVPLKFFRVLTHIFFNMRHFRLQILPPCYST